MTKMTILRKLVGILIVCSLVQRSFNKYLEVRKQSMIFYVFFSILSLFINHINGILEMIHFDRSLLDTVGGRLASPWGILGQSFI